MGTTFVVQESGGETSGLPSYSLLTRPGGVLQRVQGAEPVQSGEFRLAGTLLWFVLPGDFMNLGLSAGFLLNSSAE